MIALIAGAVSVGMVLTLYIIVIAEIKYSEGRE